MKGRLIEASNKIHFEIKSSNDIKKVGGLKISEDILENVVKTPKRKMNSQKKDESNVEKVSIKVTNKIFNDIIYLIIL